VVATESQMMSSVMGLVREVEALRTMADLLLAEAVRLKCESDSRRGSRFVRRVSALETVRCGAGQVGDSSATTSRMACQTSACTYADGRLMPVRHIPPTVNGYGRHPSLSSFLASCAIASWRALGPSVLGPRLDVIVACPAWRVLQLTVDRAAARRNLARLGFEAAPPESCWSRPARRRSALA
jgi:hypothetical protein